MSDTSALLGREYAVADARLEGSKDHDQHRARDENPYLGIHYSPEIECAWFDGWDMAERELALKAAEEKLEKEAQELEDLEKVQREVATELPWQERPSLTPAQDSTFIAGRDATSESDYDGDGGEIPGYEINRQVGGDTVHYGQVIVYGDKDLRDRIVYLLAVADIIRGGETD